MSYVDPVVVHSDYILRQLIHFGKRHIDNPVGDRIIHILMLLGNPSFLDQSKLYARKPSKARFLETSPEAGCLMILCLKKSSLYDLVGGLEHVLCFHILGKFIPIDYFSRG